MSMLTTHFSNLYMTPAIIKKLLGFKVNPNFDTNSGSTAGGAKSPASESMNSPGCATTTTSAQMSNHNKLCEKAIRQLVKKIKKNPGALEELEKAITTRNPNTKCIPIPLKSNTQQAPQLSRKTLPHVVFCRIWRWPDLQNCNELKPVTHCQHAYSHSHASSGVSSGKTKANEDAQQVCINPYHYMRNSSAADSQFSNQSSNLLTVYVPVSSSLHAQQQQQQGSTLPNSDLTPIVEDETNTNSTLSSTASTPISYSHSPQQHQMATQISSSSSTSSYSSLQNDISIPQLNGNVATTNINQLTAQNTAQTSAVTMPTSIDLIGQQQQQQQHLHQHPQANYMIGTSPLNQQPSSVEGQSNPMAMNTNSGSATEQSNMINYFMSSNSPHSPLGSSMAGNNFNMNSQSPISNSPASNSNALQQFSPFISEDDSSEINDISPSPIGSCDMMPIPMIEQPYWCSLSYYEMKQRVGEMFHVSSNVHSCTIDGYTDPSSGQRFCLGVLSNVNRTNEIEMTRHYIGRGLQLNYENGQVFAECLSENPVFVQSPNCNQRYQWHLATVVKIPPGCSLKIFDEAEFVQLANETVYQGFEAVYALTRICTIRISFVKGWGAEYRRQSILNTPCWIEVHLNNPLKLVDQILTKMGSPRTKCTSVS